MTSEATAVPAPEHARSWLLVPAGAPHLYTTAAESPADAVVLDLEDAVGPSAKPAARESVTNWLRSGGRAWVRINDTATTFWADDLAALAGIPDLEGIVLAKTEDGSQIDATAQRLPAGTRILALVESAVGIEAANEIARSEATFRLAFGSGDFRRDTGMGDDPMAMAYARTRLTVTSRAAGLPGPIDGPSLTSDGEILTRDSRLTATMGMTGKLCMQAAQAEFVNRELAPRDDEILWARNVIDELGADGSRVRDGSDLPRLARPKKISTLAAVYAGV
ncbi:CoA ester lyase [Rhodococcus sp. WS4]|nr:CoA ester lyase [Rhodococcus sp. WS4]